jgi:threonine/homoserine/homoserine lactone efflux protein
MIPAQTLSAFFAASLLLALAPGPDNLFVLTQSAIHGRRAGLTVTLGLCTGLLGHTTAVVLGLAAIFQTSAVAFTAIKLMGALYLVYLAWHAFRSSAEKIQTRNGGEPTGWALYRRGILMNITNPKVSIFFLAFLPQFANPERAPLPLQLMLLGAVFIGATLLVFGSISLLAGILGQWLSRSHRARRVMNCVAGSIFAGLALKLATSGR